MSKKKRRNIRGSSQFVTSLTTQPRACLSKASTKLSDLLSSLKIKNATSAALKSFPPLSRPRTFSHKDPLASKTIDPPPQPQGDGYEQTDQRVETLIHKFNEVFGGSFPEITVEAQCERIIQTQISTLSYVYDQKGLHPQEKEIYKQQFTDRCHALLGSMDIKDATSFKKTVTKSLPIFITKTLSPKDPLTCYDPMTNLLNSSDDGSSSKVLSEIQRLIANPDTSFQSLADILEVWRLKDPEEFDQHSPQILESIFKSNHLAVNATDAKVQKLLQNPAASATETWEAIKSWESDSPEYYSKFGSFVLDRYVNKHFPPETQEKAFSTQTFTIQDGAFTSKESTDQTQLSPTRCSAIQTALSSTPVKYLKTAYNKVDHFETYMMRKCSGKKSMAALFVLNTALLAPLYLELPATLLCGTSILLALDLVCRVSAYNHLHHMHQSSYNEVVNLIKQAPAETSYSNSSHSPS